MADEPTRFLMIGAEQLEFAASEDGKVVVRLRGLEKAAGLAPGLGVMLVLSPDEARRAGQSLHNTAQKASEKLQ